MCDLVSKNAAAFHRTVDGKVVIVEALVDYDFEHGFSLGGEQCVDSVDGTGGFAIGFPEGFGGLGEIEREKDGPFSELGKLLDDDFLPKNVGKRIYCRCIGKVTYVSDFPLFTLIRADRVWASDD